MAGQIPESDWRVLRDLKTSALDRYCQRLLADVEQIISSTTESNHERFLKVSDEEEWMSPPFRRRQR